MNYYKDDTILKSIPVGIVAVSLENSILYINERAIKFLNLSNVNINSIAICSIFPQLRRGDEKVCHLDEEIILNISKQSLLCSISPLIDNNKQIGYLIMIKDSHKTKKAITSHKSLGTRYNFDDIIGESPQIKKVIEQCKEIALNDSTVLISGESGCGKELLAQSIHNSSIRSMGPFIAVNCGAFPKNLIESELFGYENGAFTGALKGGAQGKFELANGGTIFLDEIGEMPIEMQVMLLRVLQEGVVTRIGGKEPVSIDVRVIAATNKDLKEEVKNGRFRSDLFYRLNVMPIKVPPLKDRIGDIPILLDYLLKKKSEKLGKKVPTVPAKMFKKIISYCWPGNIRELENYVENFVALNGITTYEIDLEECHCLPYDNLGNPIVKSEEDINTETTIIPLVVLEKMEIEKALKIWNGNITKVSQALGISRNALYNKIKRLGISVRESVDCKL